MERVLEGVRALKDKGSNGQDHRMSEDLVRLANCTPGNIFLDIGGEAGPPVILQKESDGAEVSTVAALEGTVGSGNQVVAGWFWDMKTSFVIVVHRQRSSLRLLTC